MALSLAVAAAACPAALALWRSLRSWQGTTLVAPIGWALAACGAAAIAELASWTGVAGKGNSTALQYLVATLTLTPGIAHLGAKRPQDRAWQLVVGTWLIVLWLPLAQGWLLGGRLYIHFLLLWGLLAPTAAIAVLNMLPTRHAPWALLTGLGQVGVWWNHFLSDSSWHWASAHEAGLLLLAAAVVLWGLTSVSRRPVLVAPGEFLASESRVVESSVLMARLNATWRDFCDAYGAVWGLRIAQRFNATAEQQGWSVRLTWFGLHHQPNAPPPLMELEAAAQSLRALWRRFVSEEWIDGQSRIG